MSDLYVCNNADKCTEKPCACRGACNHSKPHEYHDSCDGYDCMYPGVPKGSKCITVAQEVPVADPDVSMARRTASEMLHCGLISKDFAACVIRLADKVEGKKS